VKFQALVVLAALGAASCERANSADATATQKRLTYPVAQKGTVVEDLHGTKLLLGTRHERPHLPAVRNICRTDYALPAVEASLEWKVRMSADPRAKVPAT